MEETIAIKSGYYFELFPKSVLPDGVVHQGSKVAIGVEVYDLYVGTSIEAEKAIDSIYGDRMGYYLDDYLI